MKVNLKQFFTLNHSNKNTILNTLKQKINI